MGEIVREFFTEPVNTENKKKERLDGGEKNKRKQNQLLKGKILLTFFYFLWLTEKRTKEHNSIIFENPAFYICDPSHVYILWPKTCIHFVTQDMNIFWIMKNLFSPQTPPYWQKLVRPMLNQTKKQENIKLIFYKKLRLNLMFTIWNSYL